MSRNKDTRISGVKTTIIADGAYRRQRERFADWQRHVSPGTITEFVGSDHHARQGAITWDLRQLLPDQLCDEDGKLLGRPRGNFKITVEFEGVVEPYESRFPNPGGAR